MPRCCGSRSRHGRRSRVGGKNASLGRCCAPLAAAGVRVPDGFATTADAFRAHVGANGLAAVTDEALAALHAGSATLQEAGAAIRRRFLDAAIPRFTAEAIRAAYRELAQRAGHADPAVAVRSSATAEDLPPPPLRASMRRSSMSAGGRAARGLPCLLRLAVDRPRDLLPGDAGLRARQVALSVGVQLMVRADTGASGVMFSLDTESGFPGLVAISAAWGLGETVVQGLVDPDRYAVFKTPLADAAKRPILDKVCGAKARKMIYASGGSARTALVATRRASARRSC